uniref:hypothetical protein n=1 Tax=Acidovorax sp. SUPP3334 TaxID=2920881 RepID=UPI00295294A4|nr:hypothetical protein [Acidovorax sp. SUPP3334]
MRFASVESATQLQLLSSERKRLRNWAAASFEGRDNMMRGMKNLCHLIVALVIAALVGVALQPENKGLTIRVFGVQIETK